MIHINLWVDDLRDEPEGWTRALSSDEAISYLENGEVEQLSLDHDLGESDKGTNVTNWLEYQDKALGIDFWPQVMYIHSSNSVGRGNIQRCIEASGHYGRKTSGIISGVWSGIDGWMRVDNAAEFVSSSIAAYRRYRTMYFI